MISSKVVRATLTNSVLEGMGSGYINGATPIELFEASKSLPG